MTSPNCFKHMLPVVINSRMFWSMKRQQSGWNYIISYNSVMSIYPPTLTVMCWREIWYLAAIQMTINDLEPTWVGIYLHDHVMDTIYHQLSGTSSVSITLSITKLMHLGRKINLNVAERYITLWSITPIILPKLLLRSPKGQSNLLLAQRLIYSPYLNHA